MPINKLNLNSAPDYNTIISKWRASNIRPDIFEGHLLISLTSESSQIEGINVSYNRTKEILQSGTVSNYSGDIRDLFSVLNQSSLAEYFNEQLLKGTPITPDFIKKAHGKLMFGSLDNRSYHINKERAGEFKKHDYCVGKYETGLPPNEVDDAIADLCEFLTSVNESNTLKVASAFHCLFEGIHPFADGNGRVGRWLLNYFLVLNNHPPVVIRSENMTDYYECLESYDYNEDYDSMYQFLREVTVKSYSSYKYLIG